MKPVGLLFALIVLLLATSCAPSMPVWYTGYYTYYTNYEYCYTVYYPDLGRTASFPDGNLIIFLPGEVSEIQVSVYQGYYNMDDLLGTFENQIQDAKQPEPDENRQVVEKYSYIVEHVGKLAGVNSITYIYTYDYAGSKAFTEEPYKVRTRGYIYWIEGECAGETYIYKFQYETQADCERCIEHFDYLLSKTIGSVISAE